MIGGKRPLALIAGPCVIESETACLEVARFLRDLTRSLGIPFIFKSSYDKANRSSLHSYRGPGLEKGLKILARVKREFEIPVLSDVHRFEEVAAAAAVLDVLQIPGLSLPADGFCPRGRRHGEGGQREKGAVSGPLGYAERGRKN